MPSTDEAPYQPRSPAYFPHRADFERREDGSAIISSLKGPARIEAREQGARERVLDGAELKSLQEKLRWCYHKEGVNHYELCKDIADAYMAKLRTNDSWLLKASGRRGRALRAAGGGRGAPTLARVPRTLPFGWRAARPTRPSSPAAPPLLLHHPAFPTAGRGAHGGQVGRALTPRQCASGGFRIAPVDTHKHTLLF